LKPDGDQGEALYCSGVDVRKLQHKGEHYPRTKFSLTPDSSSEPMLNDLPCIDLFANFQNTTRFSQPTVSPVKNENMYDVPITKIYPADPVDHCVIAGY